MDFFVARLMSLNEHELTCLRSDQELQSHLQQTHMLMESKLQQFSNASSTPTSSSSSSSSALIVAASAAENYPSALDLRLSDQQQQQHQHQQSSSHYFSQLHQLQLLEHHQRLLQQQYQQQQQQQQQQYHHHQQQQYNYKKIKFIEWTSSGGHDIIDESSPTPSASSASTVSTTLARDDDLITVTPTTTTTTTTPVKATDSKTPTTTAITIKQHQPDPAGALTLAPPLATTGGKKYKGEFDEPNSSEVELRLKLLLRVDNYHSKMSPHGECACILGSEFRDKTGSSVLSMVEQWRQMATEQRVTFKWDMNDLPKDIPLSDIKRFENLRREASDGRADFGGASKRKPLGIRGTRQFLLILYCLWGHPGRDDPMQREGYCPHCFAKIKKPNEQSTLVRVVNHFNMKHRRGANPRIQ